MRVKLITFRYSATLGGFDDTALADFARDKEVIAFREHFYAVNEVPHLTCVVHYQDAIVPQAALDAARQIAARPMPSSTNGTRSNPNAGGYPRRDGAPDPCEGLDENERALFNHLREWRSKQSQADGVPPYLLLTNKQLVAVIRKRPDSLTALGHLDGIGPGKIERYGAAILGALHGAHAAPAARVEPGAEAAPTVSEALTSAGEQAASDVPACVSAPPSASASLTATAPARALTDPAGIELGELAPAEAIA